MFLQLLLLFYSIGLLTYIQNSDLKESLANHFSDTQNTTTPITNPTSEPQTISFKPAILGTVSSPSAQILKKATASAKKKILKETPKPSNEESKPNEIKKSFTQELLETLNNYRQKNGQATLSWDSKLAEYSITRLQTFISIGNIDNHEPFNALLNSDGFNLLGFWALAENSSVNSSPKSAQEIIENVFGQSSGHNSNQLNPAYTHVGIATNETFTNFVFGGQKI